VFATADVRGMAHEQKANAFAALSACGKRSPRHAGDLVSIGVLAAVKDGVNSRFLYSLARLERLSHAILFT
jgi:hypothetical protein